MKVSPSNNNNHQLTSVVEALESLNEAVLAARFGELQPIPTGFDPLDRYLGEGLKPGELLVMTGAQGVGKTTMAFQMARNIAAGGQAHCLYLCFEHDPQYLLARLISLESLHGRFDQPDSALPEHDLRKQLLLSRNGDNAGLFGVLEKEPRAKGVAGRLRQYGDRLLLLKGSGLHTDLDAISSLVRDQLAAGASRLVLFVDYVQKIPFFPAPAEETEKVTRVVEGLKELALTDGIAVVAISAADKEGLQAKRLRFYHLRGSSALAYEPDVILILNDKYHIVSKSAIEYNPHKAQTFKNWLICSVEKNRSGLDAVDLEFRKHFSYCCLDPRGDLVTEKLIEDRLYTE